MTVIAVIAYATLNSDPLGADEIPHIPHIDKLIHAVMFGGLFSAIVFDRSRAGMGNNTRTYIIISLVCAASGALTEVLQDAMEQGRSGDILDLAADCTGIIVAAFTAPSAIARALRKKIEGDNLP